MAEMERVGCPNSIQKQLSEGLNLLRRPTSSERRCQSFSYSPPLVPALACNKRHTHTILRRNGPLERSYQEWPRQTKPKKGQFMNFSQGHSGTKTQRESCLFSNGKTSDFTKMGEIHELFVLAISLVCFAGATPDLRFRFREVLGKVLRSNLRRFLGGPSIRPLTRALGKAPRKQSVLHSLVHWLKFRMSPSRAA